MNAPNIHRPAAFLDRDGTLIPDRGFLGDPAGVELLEGTIQALADLRDAGFRIVAVTNQSGISRGLISWDQYHAVEAELDRQLLAAGVGLDATYVCPHYPPISGPCDCRKPGLKHYRDAETRFGIDLGRSLFVGDRLSDLLPALELGGRGVLVETGEGLTHAAEARDRGFDVLPDLLAVVRNTLSNKA
jgi:histidinol-phosphate phosphatase family protein